MPEAPLFSEIRCDHPNKRSSSVHNRNYLIYIATRDGVDLTNVELERELRQMQEEATHQDEHADNEHYLKYIHERPGSQGLFGNIDVSNPTKLGNHLADLTGQGYPIYRGIISLREDDALKIGFDRKESWVDYLNIVMPDVAREFNIPIDKLEWAAAFHIKNGHPHCHYMFWSKDKQVTNPYIHISKQVRCRELLSKEMFHLEREQAVLDKTAARDLLAQVTKELTQDQVKLLINEKDKLSGFFQTEDVKALSQELVKFTSSLQGQKGRLAYKLLPLERKKELDALVDKLLQSRPLSIDYYRYLHAVDDISATYSASQRHSEVNRNIADEDLRKRMGNIVLKSCKQLLLERERLSIELPNMETDWLSKETSAPGAVEDFEDFDAFEAPEDFSGYIKILPSGSYHISWTPEYKKAMSIIYDEDISDKSLSISILEKEMNGNNVLACHQLARMYEKGIVVPEDASKARILYDKAFRGFSNCLEDPAYDKLHSYIHYRLGKYYESGSGTLIDYEKAIEHYSEAGNNKYALYSLGSMFQRGKGIEITPENEASWLREAGDCFRASANYVSNKGIEEPFPYAAYAYAKLCENHPDIFHQDAQIISRYYSIAFNGFITMLQEQPNDDLYYRVGTMYYKGNGTKPDQDKAYDFFLKSAEYNNANAQYALGKTFADPDTKYYDLEKAIEMFTLASNQGNDYATCALGKIYATEGEYFDHQKAHDLLTSIRESLPDQANYALGKMYASPNTPFYNPELAAQYLSISAGYNNANALYALAKIYLNEECSLFDAPKGVQLLQTSATAGNAYAMAKLGNMYLWGKHVPADEAIGKYWLNEAIKNGNPYAQDSLNVYENYQKDIAVSLSFSMCRNLLKLCSNRQQPENINSILSKVRTKEAARDAQKRDEKER